MAHLMPLRSETLRCSRPKKVATPAWIMIPSLWTAGSVIGLLCSAGRVRVIAILVVGTRPERNEGVDDGQDRIQPAWRAK